MTTALPDVTVEMSTDGSSWQDMSLYVNLSRGLTCGRGRSNEFESCAPGTLRFSMDNRITAYSVPDWSPGGVWDAFGLLAKNTHVRVKVDSTQVWQGRIDSFKLRPPVGGVGAGTVDVSATDECKTFAKARLYPYGIEHQATDLAWTGGGIFPMQPKDVGSYLSAHRDPSLGRMSVAVGSQGGREYSQDGPPYVKQSMKLIPRASIGPVMEHPTTWNPGTEYGLASVWFRTTSSDTGYLFHMERTSGGTGYASIVLNQTTVGKLTFTVAGDSGGVVNAEAADADLNDGDWHHVAAWFRPGSGTTVRVYIDGVIRAIGNSGGTACTIGSGNRRAVFGGNRNSAWTENTYVFDGDIAAPAVWIYSTTSDAPNSWYAAGMTGRPGQTIGSRVGELAGFVGAATPGVSETSGYDVAGQDLDGRSLLDAYQQLAEGELGVFYVDRTGDPQVRGFAARSAASSVVTISAVDDLDADAELVLDDATYANYVRATSPSGVVVKYDSALVASDGAALIDEWATLIHDETELAAHADNRLAMRSTQLPRLGKITVDLLTAATVTPSAVLTLEPLDRVTVNELDANLFGATSMHGFVEGWELSVSTREYSVELDLSPDIF